MNAIDKANKYVGHEQEPDEGYEVSMTRTAYVTGYCDAVNDVLTWLEEHWNDFFGEDDDFNGWMMIKEIKEQYDNRI